MQIRHFLEHIGPHGLAIAQEARRLILVDEGWMSLMSQGANAVTEFHAYLLQCDDEMMPTVVEALAEAASRDLPDTRTIGGSFHGYRVEGAFTESVNQILRRHRIAFELIEKQMVEKNSMELHTEVVAPALRLLATSDRAWAGAEKAYRGALTELSENNPPDAITDAGTALQEALQAAGAEGNALGPLITSARKRRILAPHDQALGDAITKAADWVSADRSQSGDAHRASDANLDDAWLIVHVVGALILRLSKGSARV